MQGKFRRDYIFLVINVNLLRKIFCHPRCNAMETLDPLNNYNSLKIDNINNVIIGGFPDFAENDNISLHNNNQTFIINSNII